MRWIFICAILIPSWAAAREFHAGLHAVSFDYKEDVPAPLRSREKGTLPALELGLSFEPEPDFFLRGIYMGSHRVMTTYEGSQLATETDVSTRDNHTMHHVDLLVENAGPNVTLYGGLSYDEWNRFLSYGSGYREIYRWWTIPLGISVPYTTAPGLNADFAVLIMIKGDMDVIFTETIEGGQNTRLRLGNRVGWRLRFPYEFTGWDESWTLTPWVQSTSFGASPSEPNETPGLGGAVREPASQTLQIGLGIRWNRAF